MSSEDLTADGWGEIDADDDGAIGSRFFGKTVD